MDRRQGSRVAGVDHGGVDASDSLTWYCVADFTASKSRAKLGRGKIRILYMGIDLDCACNYLEPGTVIGSGKSSDEAEDRATIEVRKQWRLGNDIPYRSGERKRPSKVYSRDLQSADALPRPILGSGDHVKPKVDARPH